VTHTMPSRRHPFGLRRLRGPPPVLRLPMRTQESLCGLLGIKPLMRRSASGPAVATVVGRQRQLRVDALLRGERRVVEGPPEELEPGATVFTPDPTDPEAFNQALARTAEQDALRTLRRRLTTTWPIEGSARMVQNGLPGVQLRVCGLLRSWGSALRWEDARAAALSLLGLSTLRGVSSLPELDPRQLARRCLAERALLWPTHLRGGVTVPAVATGEAPWGTISRMAVDRGEMEYRRWLIAHALEGELRCCCWMTNLFEPDMRSFTLSTNCRLERVWLPEPAWAERCPEGCGCRAAGPLLAAAAATYRKAQARYAACGELLTRGAPLAQRAMLAMGRTTAPNPLSLTLSAPALWSLLRVLRAALVARVLACCTLVRAADAWHKAVHQIKSWACFAPALMQHGLRTREHACAAGVSGCTYSLICPHCLNPAVAVCVHDFKKSLLEGEVACVHHAPQRLPCITNEPRALPCPHCPPPSPLSLDRLRQLAV